MVRFMNDNVVKLNKLKDPSNLINVLICYPIRENERYLREYTFCLNLVLNLLKFGIVQYYAVP